MSTTNSYVIDKKTKELKPHGSFNSREYWVPGGENY